MIRYVMWIRKFEFVAKTQFLNASLLLRLCDLVPSLVLILRTSMIKKILVCTLENSKLFCLLNSSIIRGVLIENSLVFQFQHVGCFGPVVRHHKCNLKSSKSTFESIKSNKQSNLMSGSPFFEKILTFYSESQIYEYKARVFYNVVFSTYLGSNAAEKRV